MRKRRTGSKSGATKAPNSAERDSGAGTGPGTIPTRPRRSSPGRRSGSERRSDCGSGDTGTGCGWRSSGRRDGSRLPGGKEATARKRGSFPGWRLPTPEERREQDNLERRVARAERKRAERRRERKVATEDSGHHPAPSGVGNVNAIPTYRSRCNDCGRAFDRPETRYACVCDACGGREFDGYGRYQTLPAECFQAPSAPVALPDPPGRAWEPWDPLRWKRDEEKG